MAAMVSSRYRGCAHGYGHGLQPSGRLTLPEPTHADHARRESSPDNPNLSILIETGHNTGRRSLCTTGAIPGHPIPLGDSSYCLNRNRMSRDPVGRIQTARARSRIRNSGRPARRSRPRILLHDGSKLPCCTRFAKAETAVLRGGIPHHWLVGCYPTRRVMEIILPGHANQACAFVGLELPNNSDSDADGTIDLTTPGRCHK